MARAGRHLAHDVGRINSLILDTDGARNKHLILADVQNYEECSKKYFIVIVNSYSHLLIRVHETNVWSIPVFYMACGASYTGLPLYKDLYRVAQGYYEAFFFGV